MRVRKLKKVEASIGWASTLKDISMIRVAVYRMGLMDPSVRYVETWMVAPYYAMASKMWFVDDEVVAATGLEPATYPL